MGADARDEDHEGDEGRNLQDSTRARGREDERKGEGCVFGVE